jgi:myxalamid-type polyketide synthase MxaC
MSPKTQGGWSFHVHTQGMPLDFFVMFSSASAIIGNLGQSNYASANAFLDGLCAYRRSLGLPGTSINWGPWADVGMASTTDEGAIARWKEGGISLIQLDDGLTILDRMLSASTAQLAVLDIKWRKYGKQIDPGMEPSMLLDLLPKKAKRQAKGVSGKKSKGGDSGESKVMAELAATPKDLRLNVLMEHIKTAVIRVLVLDPNDELDVHRPLTELGMDSLMVRELSTALGNALSIKLPVTLAYDYPNVEAMATFVLSKLKIKEVSSTPKPAAPAPAAKAAAAPAPGPAAAASSTAADAPAATGPRLSDEPLAVLGMACRMPKTGSTPDLFWGELYDSTDCIELEVGRLPHGWSGHVRPAFLRHFSA